MAILNDQEESFLSSLILCPRSLEFPHIFGPQPLVHPQPTEDFHSQFEQQDSFLHAAQGTRLMRRLLEGCTDSL